ncbi:hypothetical protein J26TS2_34830 [Shouchella clausii]|nr:hypothetical protein J26TS2_34830 [Shouchella clausii]
MKKALIDRRCTFTFVSFAPSLSVDQPSQAFRLIKFGDEKETEQMFPFSFVSGRIE